ncbi:MAG: NAD-dependent epimerase/dehydratase family protein, partial [Ferruginibacter sp.]|nr:NAD-dependent epimerase/dehydratase family protein [Ferruginibacter sp.]
MQDIRSRKTDYSPFFGKTVLVTGAAGFLASYLIDFLLYLNKMDQAQIKIIGLVRNLDKAKKRFANVNHLNFLELIEHDASEPFSTNQQINYIIHAASNASPKYYGVDPIGTAKPNTIGTYWLLELARMKNVSGFLFVSSGEVYGQLPAEKIPILETDFGSVDPTEIRSCYAESKRFGENLCACYSFQHQVPTKIVRPFHTYGPGMPLDDGRVFTDFIRNILNNQDIEMKGDGTA